MSSDAKMRQSKPNTGIQVHLTFRDQSGSDGREMSNDSCNALFDLDMIKDVRT